MNKDLFNRHARRAKFIDQRAKFFMQCSKPRGNGILGIEAHHARFHQRWLRGTRSKFHAGVAGDAQSRIDAKESHGARPAGVDGVAGGIPVTGEVAVVGCVSVAGATSPARRISSSTRVPGSGIRSEFACHSGASSSA